MAPPLALSIVSAALVPEEASPTRVAAQVVSGIGFLGAGLIFREGMSVGGLNTAATLWCSAAIGVLAGAGYLAYAALTGTPWQNGYAERLIGTIRRECVDHVIVFGEAHLRRILGEFAAYYNESRTHRALSKDAPVHRAIERLGDITSRPILGDLHQYCRI
jgi:MgtC family/Integrase core domain